MKIDPGRPVRATPAAAQGGTGQVVQLQAISKKILVPDRVGGKIKTGAILKYSEDLNFAPNKDMGPKDFF